MTAENIDRRKLIKRAAAAGGIVWAAPVIESMVHAAAGTPPPTTTSTTEEPTTTTSTSTSSTTSTSTTSTTIQEPCDSTVCAKAVLPAGTVYFVGTPTNPEDRDCLCMCADPDFQGTCSQTNPCDYPVTFTPCPTVNVCCCPPDLCT